MHRVKKSKILIVDDSSTNIEILTQMLSDLYEVYSSRESGKALKMVKDHKIDLILLDVEMPVMTGYEVCTLLKTDEETRNIPVIFVTGKSDPEDEEKGLGTGAIDYIIKPFSPAIIKSRIRNHINLKNYQDMLSELSNRDGLTGLFNKRRFEEIFQLEWRRAARMKNSLSLLLIDIDFFKKYNDHYGHLDGDNCLKSVASSIDATIHRPGDLAARFGGEEFVCLLPNTDHDGAIQISRQILKNIKKLNLPHVASSVSDRVTISLGACTMNSIDDSISMHDFIDKADKMLYKAKESGRNRICAGIFKN